MRCILGDKQVAYGLKEAWASTNLRLKFSLIKLNCSH